MPTLPVVTPPSPPLTPAPSPALAPPLVVTPQEDTQPTLHTTAPASPSVILPKEDTQPTLHIVTHPLPQSAGTAATPAWRNRRSVASVAVIVVLLVAGLLVAGFNTAQAEVQPASVAQAYCQDLLREQYSNAYALLSSRFQTRVSLPEFTQMSRFQDGVDGKVRACPTASGPAIDFAFGSPQDRAAFVITILRGKPFTGQIELVRGQHAWRVDTLEQSLQGTDVGPLLVADTFCRGVMQGDYGAAYRTLSTRQQGLASEIVFAQQFKSAFGGLVRLESCAPSYTSYHVQAGSAAVSMSFNLGVSTPTAGSLSTSLVTVLDFIQESGSWKVNDFIPLPQSS